MGVVYGCGLDIRRGFGVGLPVPETNFEKLGPMLSPLILALRHQTGSCHERYQRP